MLEGTNPASCFPRTAVGYEAACYSRIWSEVFAADIFASKLCDDLMNQQAGLLVRNKNSATKPVQTPHGYFSSTYLGMSSYGSAVMNAHLCHHMKFHFLEARHIITTMEAVFLPEALINLCIYLHLHLILVDP